MTAPAIAATAGRVAPAVATTAPPLVWGPRKQVVKARIWMRVARLALEHCGGPVRAAAVLRRMVRERGQVQRWTTQRYAHAGGRWFWNLYSPGFPSPAFDAWVRRELERADPEPGARPGLQTVVFAITRRCALRCEHCCEWEVLNRHEALTSAELTEIVTRIRRRGTGQLFLSGGEPLRRLGDVLAIAKAASPDVDVWILSSGHGLTAERARRLRDAGLTGVSLSVDHWDPERHDSFRGMPGAFAAAAAAAMHARDAGLVVALSLCPTREFVSDENLGRYLDMAAGLGASFVQLLEPKAIGHWAGRDVTLAPHQQRMLDAFALRTNADPARRHLPAVSYPDGASRASGCRGAGDRHLYIDTDGSVHPCPFCRESAGCALDGDFDDTLAALQARGCRVPQPE